ncbi:MAG TPA: glutathione peroxidase [Chitinophagaceae bacterium]|nr:glutathione peroxidase [Chitinophagaceae bacterium]HRF18112.1 glutathione peroxidase [Chitinophagaceae bacterium]
MRKLKRLAIVILLLIAVFVVYVEIVNRNSKNMTYRQKVLKAVYPAWMWITKLTGKNTKKMNNESAKTPFQSFYDLSATQIDGKEIKFADFKGKKLLLVNTASDCGYTNQYADLQKLYEDFSNKLVVIGFPANDFKEQEKGTDKEIAQFCQKNYGVTFPIMKKSVVIKSEQQNPVYQWLTDSSKNGWCNQQPSWNFSKYLLDENGVLTNYFDPSVSPLSKEITDKLR